MRRLFVAILLVLLAIAVSACAAINVQQHVWMPGTTLEVVNSADQPFDVFLDDRLVRSALPVGAMWSARFFSGLGIVLDAGARRSSVVTIRFNNTIIRGARVEMYADAYTASSRTIAIYVRRDERGGYRMDGPGWSAY